MTQDRLCVVDGTYELFRAYFGAPKRLSPEGQEVGATIALGRSLRALAHSGEFSHLAVAFDTVIESFRNALFEGYKTGEGVEPELLAQFPLAERMAQSLGLCVFGMIEFEADDALASAAAQFRSRANEVVIASPDKDLLQCVRPGVTTWDRLREKTYDEAGVVEKLGIVPALIPDYLALVGDTADGIPGVPKWGAKSAAATLSRFGSLERIPRDQLAWDIKLRGLPALLEQLKIHEEQVLLYRTLATLREDVDLGVGFDDMKYRGADESALASISEELGVAVRG